MSKVINTYEPFLSHQIDESFLEAFNNGVISIEQGKIEDAIKYYNQSNSLRPGGDAASKIWIKECDNSLESGRIVGAKAMKK